MIEPDDFHLKHHIYTELAALPVRDFNYKMREIMGNTKEGKKIMKKLVDEIKGGLQEDEFNEAMQEIEGKNQNVIETDEEDGEGYDFDDLFNGGTGEKPKNDDGGGEGFSFDDLINGTN